MAALEYFSPQGINTYFNPVSADGQVITATNVINFPFGAISKRGGYNSFLNNPDGAQVNALFNFPFQNGTQSYLYRASGSTLYYSSQGTANWATANMGHIANNAYVGNAVFNNILAIGDGSNTLWTSANGTVFTQPGSAPVAQYLAVFHNRLYATDGTSSNVNYSVTNDPTNWQNSGTSDSSFLVTTSPGANTGMLVAGDRLTIGKNKGNMFNWDDANLVDMSTIFGPTSPRSIAQIDDYWFYINAFGLFGFDGASKTVLSNPLQRQFYNRLGVAVSGVNLINSGNVLGASYIWDYLAVVGNINDDFTGRALPNAIIKYDYQKNQFVNWVLSDFPTAINSYIDNNNHQQLIFGNSSGQVFQYDPGATADNGAAIASELVLLFTYALQGSTFSPTSAQTILGSSYEKKWNWIRLFFNPGCEINVQFAFSNTMQYQHLRWSEALNIKPNATGDYWQESDGVVELRFPDNENNPRRSRFLFLRLYEDSAKAQWTYYGSQIGAEIQQIQ